VAKRRDKLVMFECQYLLEAVTAW